MFFGHLYAIYDLCLSLMRERAPNFEPAIFWRDSNIFVESFRKSNIGKIWRILSLSKNLKFVVIDHPCSSKPESKSCTIYLPNFLKLCTRDPILRTQLLTTHIFFNSSYFRSYGLFPVYINFIS